MSPLKYVTILVIFLFLLSLPSCAIEQKPEEVLENYISLLLRGYIDHAYELLSAKVKEKSTREEFIHALKIYQGRLKSFHLISKKEDNGIVALEYEVVIIPEQGKEKKLTSTAYLSQENRKWKILNPGF